MEYSEDIKREHTKKETDAGCPSCGAPLEFDPESGGVFCRFCGYRGEIVDNGETVDEQDFSHAEHVENFSWGASQKQVICRSCGAQTVYDDLETSGTCPYCGSQQVMSEAVDTSLPPNGVCVFEVSREQAGSNFKKWLKKRLFTPSAAKKHAEADGFSGMYVPYWTFDSDTVSTFSGRYGIDRQEKTKNGTRTVTDWYNTSGTYSRFIDDELVIASNRHNDSTLRKIEPFELEKSRSYRPEFLAGFGSERYSVGLVDAWETGKKQIDARIKSAIEDEVKKQHSADRVDIKKVTTQYNDITYKYMLLPLWMSNYSYKQKKYEFMVNGQTGKVGGRAPVSALRVLVAVVIAIAVLAGIFLLMGSDDSGQDLASSAAAEIAPCESGGATVECAAEDGFASVFDVGEYIDSDDPGARIAALPARA